MKSLSVICALALLGLTYSYAQRLGFNAPDQSIWEEHLTEIESHARFLYEEISYEFANTYEIPPSNKKLIDNLIKNKELKKYLCNYKSYESISDRVREKGQIDSTYLDSIFTLLVPYNPQMTGKAISLSLFFSQELSLSNDIVKVLTEKAVEFARRLHKNPCASFAVEEISVLKQQLTDSQLQDLLEEKNSKEAKAKAFHAWETLAKEQLTIEMDSINDIGRAYLYYRMEMCLKDYYADNKELLDNNLADLYKHKPRIIQMCDGLWQKKQILKKYEKKVNSGYSW